MGKTYKLGTLKLIDSLGIADTKIEEGITENKGKKLKRFWLNVDSSTWTLPTKSELIIAALHFSDSPKNELTPDEKRQLSARTGKDYSLFCQVISDYKSNEATKDIILCAQLLRTRVRSSEEVRHILRQNSREDLYPFTSDINENCRNLLLSLCFDHAHRAPKCPTTDWLVFTNSLILWFNNQLNLRMEPLEVGEPDYGFTATEEYAGMLKDWTEKLKKVSFCYLGDYRCALMDAYIEKNAKSGIKNYMDVRNCMAETMGYEECAFRPVFCKRPSRPGNRSILIEAAILLGCSLAETNLLLRQAGCAILYPNKSARDGEDLLFVRRLKQNNGILAPEELEDFLTKGEIPYGKQD